MIGGVNYGTVFERRVKLKLVSGKFSNEIERFHKYQLWLSRTF